MRSILFILIALASKWASASPAPGQFLGTVGTSGSIKFTISQDGRKVTLQNEKLHKAILVDAVQRCGARAIAEPGKQDVVYGVSDLRIINANHCTLIIPHDASQSICHGCD